MTLPRVSSASCAHSSLAAHRPSRKSHAAALRVNVFRHVERLQYYRSHARAERALQARNRRQPQVPPTAIDVSTLTSQRLRLPLLYMPSLRYRAHQHLLFLISPGRMRPHRSSCLAPVGGPNGMVDRLHSKLLTEGRNGRSFLGYRAKIMSP